jgi:hypothetical protein
MQIRISVQTNLEEITLLCEDLAIHLCVFDFVSCFVTTFAVAVAVAPPRLMSDSYFM